MKRNIYIKIVLISCLSLFFLNSSFSQCKNFAKKSCIPMLAPFIFNGQLNNAILSEGDVAELTIPFIANQSYRIYVCYMEPLKNVEFSLVDNNQNVIFNNKDNNYSNYWDFKTTSTQQFTVKIKVPKEKSINDIVVSGCVSIIVGFINK